MAQTRRANYNRAGHRQSFSSAKMIQSKAETPSNSKGWQQFFPRLVHCRHDSFFLFVLLREKRPPIANLIARFNRFHPNSLVAYHPSNRFIFSSSFVRISLSFAVFFLTLRFFLHLFIFSSCRFFWPSNLSFLL